MKTGKGTEQEQQQEMGEGEGGWNWRELSAGAHNAGDQPWKGTGRQQLEIAEAPKGPRAGDIGGPQGLGDRKQRHPPKKHETRRGRR